MQRDNIQHTVRSIAKQVSRIDNDYNRIVRNMSKKKSPKPRDLRRCVCKGAFCVVCPDVPPCVIAGIERDCGEYQNDHGTQPACKYVGSSECPCMTTATSKRMKAYHKWLETHVDATLSTKLARYASRGSNDYKYCRKCETLLGYDNTSGLCRSCTRKGKS